MVDTVNNAPIVRQYLTYIPQFIRSSDFPSGAYVYPSEFFEANFGPTETLHEDQMFNQHKNGQDCRRLAWIEGPADHLSTGSNITVARFAAGQGMRNFCAQALTIEEALALAQAFSPARASQRSNMVGTTVSAVTNFQIGECRIVDGKIVQEITEV